MTGAELIVERPCVEVAVVDAAAVMLFDAPAELKEGNVGKGAEGAVRGTDEPAIALGRPGGN